MLLLSILAFVLLNIVYLIGFFGLSIALNVTDTQYFLGYNPGLIKFQIRNVKFNIGFYIPIVGLSPIYTLVNGEKRMKYPWEFHQHSLTKRLMATYGGVISLAIAGIAIFIAQAYFTTETIITKDEINKHGIYPSKLARIAGFLPGDQIVAVNGKDYREFSDLMTPEMLVAPEVNYTVMRKGEKIEVTIEDIAQNLNTKEQQPFLSLRAPFEVLEIMPGSAAERAGIKPGDKVTKVNEQPVIKFTEMTEAFLADDDGRVSLMVEKKTDDGFKAFTLDVTLDDERKIGILPKELINYTVKKNSLGEALQNGLSLAYATVFTNTRSFARLISGNLAPKNTLSGPIRIRQRSQEYFWWTAGAFALWYAFWNFLPLPKSAFWEVIPLAYEGLTKKKYPHTAFRWSTSVSWILLGASILWILIHDIIKLFSA